MLEVSISRRGVATMLLNRPELGNRYNPHMLTALQHELARLGAEPQARVLVIRGAGRHFCVGADIGWHRDSARPNAESETDQAPNLSAVLAELDRFAKPTVALVHGGCIGGGAGLAAACDIVLAETQAFFSIPEVRLGLCPASLMPLFIRAIGARQVRRYALSGERIAAAEAVRIGLAHEIYAAPDADKTLSRVVEALLLGGPHAIAETKACTARLATPNVADAELSAMEAAFAQARASPEAVEGLASFMEKRKPDWYPAEPAD